jgi:hypothetical protein
MQFEVALMTYLEGQTALMAAVNYRINYVRALQEWGGESPYIVFQMIDRPSLHSQDGADNVASPRVQFSIFANTYGELPPIAKLLRTALDGYKGAMGNAGAEAGVTIQGAFWEDETDLDPGDNGLYGKAADYIITHGAES